MPNPDYYVDEVPLKNIGLIGGIAFEVGKWGGTRSMGLRRSCFSPSFSSNDIECCCCVVPLGACFTSWRLCPAPELVSAPLAMA